MIDNLSNKLIYIDSELNRSMLCEGCKRKKSDKLMDKLTNILNKLTNKSYLSVEITRLSNELLETLEMMENCSSCKAIGKYKFKSINEIEYLLNKLEKEEQKGEKGKTIKNLVDKLIYIDSEL